MHTSTCELVIMKWIDESSLHINCNCGEDMPDGGEGNCGGPMEVK